MKHIYFNQLNRANIGALLLLASLAGAACAVNSIIPAIGGNDKRPVELLAVDDAGPPPPPPDDPDSRPSPTLPLPPPSPALALAAR